MDPNEIKPELCYRLENGQVIRVTAVNAALVHYDVFNKQQRMWLHGYNPIPASMVKEPCEGPSFEIALNQCYRLSTGQIVKVMAIDEAMVICNLFNEQTKAWVEMFNPTASTMLQEMCADPSVSTGG